MKPFQVEQVRNIIRQATHGRDRAHYEKRSGYVDWFQHIIDLAESVIIADDESQLYPKD